MIWRYITFCVFVSIFVCWVYHKELNSLTYGQLILICFLSAVPIFNVVLFLMFLLPAFDDILDKEVFK